MSPIRAGQAAVAIQALAGSLTQMANREAIYCAVYGKNRITSQVQFLPDGGKGVTFKRLTREEIRDAERVASEATSQHVESLSRTMKAILEAGSTEAEISRLCARSATRFARELTNRARNQQEYQTAKELGETWRWVDCDDGRVRKTHRQVNGEEVTIGEPFSNGLLFPRDPEGEREEVDGCRCRVQVTS